MARFSAKQTFVILIKSTAEIPSSAILKPLSKIGKQESIQKHEDCLTTLRPLIHPFNHNLLER